MPSVCVVRASFLLFIVPLHHQRTTALLSVGHDPEPRIPCRQEGLHSSVSLSLFCQRAGLTASEAGAAGMGSSFILLIALTSLPEPLSLGMGSPRKDSYAQISIHCQSLRVSNMGHIFLMSSPNFLPS